MKKILLGFTTLLVLSLTVGCIERTETITIDEHGDATFDLIFEGDYNQFDKYIALPKEPDWNIIEYKADSTSKNGKLKLKATQFCRYQAELPRTFATRDDDYKRSRLEFPTMIQVRQEKNRTIYTFKRQYQGRRFMRLHGPKDMRADSDLENKIIENGIFNVTEKERDQYLGDLAMQYAVLNFYQLSDLLGDLVLSGYLSTAQKQEIEIQASDYLENKLTPDLLLKILEKNDSQIENEYDKLREEVQEKFASIASKVAGKDFESKSSQFWSRYDQVMVDNYITEKLGSHTFNINLSMPGEIIQTNGFTEPGEHGKVTWQFTGEDLFDCNLEINAISVLEH